MLVEKLPGYEDGMLIRRPDFNNMTKREQQLTTEIYANIYGWLAKAGNQNSKVALKTKSIKTKPNSDIVGWWKSVNDIFKLSANKIVKRVKNFDLMYQYIGYKSNPQDRCVLNFTARGVQCTVFVDVYDLLVTCCDQELMDDTVSKLIA